MSAPIHLLVPSTSPPLLQSACLAPLAAVWAPDATDDHRKATCIRCLMELADREGRDLSLAEQRRAVGSYPRFRARSGYGGSTWTVEDEDQQRTVLFELAEGQARRIALLLEMELNQEGT